MIIQHITPFSLSLSLSNSNVHELKMASMHDMLPQYDLRSCKNDVAVVDEQFAGLLL